LIHYFINKNGVQQGPFTFEEIKTKTLSSKTQVWKTGLDDWLDANELEELKSCIIATPPPIKKNVERTVSIPPKKYDDSYDKEIFALFIGVIILLYNIAVIAEWVTFKKEAERTALIIMTIVRVIAAVWVATIAKSQNRTPAIWAIFAFFLPPIALIIIGLTNKKWIEKEKFTYQTKRSHASTGETTSTRENNTFAEWRKTNPKKSLNDYYMEINKTKKK